MTRRRGGAPRHAAAIGAVVLGLAAGAGGCGNSVVVGHDAGKGGAGGNGHTTFSTVERLVSGGVDKVDLILTIDNARSMADKQAILAATLPDLVGGLVSPSCVDSAGAPAAQQPAGPLDPCPDPTTRRRFRAITDIHIGVVTSSLGGHGSDACPDSETFSCPGGATNTSNNDHGHLVSRLDPCMGGSAPTYQGQGFLAWDPTGTADTPPGESNLGAVTIDTTTGAVTTAMPGLVPNLKDMVLGAGQVGCGYASSLEGWYRFLVDPDPPQSLMVNASGQVVRVGLDNILLQQRADFLRPSSLLAIIGLTDEDDCSIKEYGQYYLVAQQRDPSNPNQSFHLPKARSECTTNPNDTCCLSCGQDQTGCPADPGCGALDDKTDDVNLRCWDQKRRFGIDFLYPIDRYVTGLTQPVVPNRMGEMVANPIFTNLNPSSHDSSVRDPSLVFLASIAGVPWQDIARDPTDLTKGFKSAHELAMPDASGHTTWDDVIGDPANFVAPRDPHMIESSTPRTGMDPITGDTLAPPAMTEGGPDKINGHEYTSGTVMGVQDHPDDLEYACLFPLPTPRDCSAPGVVACDCTDPKNDNPLCADNGANGRTLQTHAKGYPGIRPLSLVKALGAQGAVGSICPAQLDDPSSADFGYRPAAEGLLDQIAPAFGASCFPTQLSVDAAGQISCAVVEGRNSGQHLDASACAGFCAGLPGRAALSGAQAALREVALADPAALALGIDCVCEIPQLGGPPASPACQSIGSALAACQCDDSSDTPTFGGQSVDGWCYVDPAQGAGNPQIVESCPAADRRQLRFVGAGAPASGALVLIACAD